MQDLTIPDTLDFGFGPMYELAYLEQVLSIPRRTAFKFLRALRIKPMYIGKKVYYSHVTFKRIMFVLSKPNAPGFVFPGSVKKSDSRTNKSEGLLTEVTDEILEQAAKPETLSEMAASDGKNPNLLKQFITKPVGRPPKNRNDK